MQKPVVAAHLTYNNENPMGNKVVVVVVVVVPSTQPHLSPFPRLYGRMGMTMGACARIENKKKLFILFPFFVLFFLKEVGLTSMRICVKDLSGAGSKHDPLSVSYVVIGGWH